MYCYLDLEAYNTLPPGRPYLLRAQFEPETLPPRRSDSERFPFPMHDPAEFSDDFRQVLANCKGNDNCSWDSVFWAEGKDQKEIEEIGRAYVYPGGDAVDDMVDRWNDILVSFLFGVVLTSRRVSDGTN